LKQYPEIDQYLQNKLEENHWFENKRRCFSSFARGIFQPVICCCGKEVPLMKAIYGGTHCCSKCAANDTEIISKRVQTNI
jgi:hypothetical protein